MSILNIRNAGLRDWQSVSSAMHWFTDNRKPDTPDEIWFVEHTPVFTQGQAGKAEHLLKKVTIPVVQSDRGGQITYHGPGQQVMYCLIDLKRAKLTVRQLVTLLEETVINTLAEYHIQAMAKRDAPGVYVNGEKICSLGLRIRRGCSFHGLALNVDMDLTPFQAINPCGYQGLKMTQLSHLQESIQLPQVRRQLINNFLLLQPYSSINWIQETKVLLPPTITATD